MRASTHPTGLTLAELVVVLAVLVVLGALVLPTAGRSVSDARDSVTRQNLTRLRDVIAETYWPDACANLPRPNLDVSPSRQPHPQLRYLFVNPNTEDTTVDYDPAYCRGWRGPYMVARPGAVYKVDALAKFTNLYGENNDPAACDGWGRPIVLQSPFVFADGRGDVRLVSAGPDGVLDTPPTVATSALTAADVGDDLWLAFEVRP